MTCWWLVGLLQIWNPAGGGLSAVVCWQWCWFDWSVEGSWHGFCHVFLGQHRISRDLQNLGSVLFILTCEWIRVYSQIEDSLVCTTHTLTRVSSLCTAANELQRGLCTCVLLPQHVKQLMNLSLTQAEPTTSNYTANVLMVWHLKSLATMATIIRIQLDTQLY